MSKFFINRPVFAWVVALFIIFLGLLSLNTLPVEQYPSIGAPTIKVTTIYPGASAKLHEESVLSVIEREMNGIEGLDYMSASAGANGMGSLTLTFRSGTDKDVAQINVQNRLQQAESRLPESVKQNGISVTQTTSNMLMVVSITAKDGSNFDSIAMNDYAVRNLVPELQRIKGVGSVQQFGAESSMRIWLNPEKLRGYGLNASDVANAIRTQNMQIASGGIGSLPALEGQMFSATVNVTGQLSTIEEFENIVISSSINGTTLRLKDVARVEVGQQGYDAQARTNGKESMAMGIQLSTTGNAVETASLVKKRMQELEAYFPEGLEWGIPYDTSTFINISIKKVIATLIEAIVLVFVVMFLFLQNLRYTLIPTIVVPISLLGAIAVMTPLGMSINVLTMFAMVLVIGIVVDDAIVVVENVERLMMEDKLTPYQATIKSMGQISSAIVGITVVNVVVFLPMAFFDGATGAIYRQFALVMAGSITFSGFLALTLTPALCATLLKPVAHHHEPNGFFGWFNRKLKSMTDKYERTIGKALHIPYTMMVIYLGICLGAGYIFTKLPSSFLPDEDQGFVMSVVQLPAGASAERTLETLDEITEIVRAMPEVQNMIAIQGFSFFGAGQNMGMAFISLKDWSEREGFGSSAQVLSRKLMGEFLAKLRGATVFALSPPSIPALGTSSGFKLILQDRAGAGHEALTAARNQLMGMMFAKPELFTDIRPDGLADAAQLRLHINRDAAYAQGVNMASIAQVLATNLGSAYINDYPNKGRLQRVTMQADANARMQEDDILALNVTNHMGQAVPLSTIASTSWEMGPLQSERYNGYPSLGLSGAAAAGKSTGEAMAEIEQLAKALPAGFAIEWTGLSLEEKRAGDQQMYVYIATVIVIFLCLAALYESWSIPLAVLLVVPLGILGVAAGVLGRSTFNYQLLLHFAGEQVAQMAERFSNDIYFQVGMITVMGLNAKNAILIIEFAKELQESGMERVQAAIQAAKLRFRPILMTSLAFILGVVPLYIATGASSASQRAIGTSVFWGMTVGTILGLIFIPIFFAVVRRIFKGQRVLDKYAQPLPTHPEVTH
ncbi:MAG: efflux RND transporter permease subunit [Cardiobacteriaceae bacterium]|nr:efflux RND transporter permease subunit [Cardiobacteriaceae bacterium]